MQEINLFVVFICASAISKRKLSVALLKVLAHSHRYPMQVPSWVLLFGCFFVYCLLQCTPHHSETEDHSHTEAALIKHLPAFAATLNCKCKELNWSK